MDFQFNINNILPKKINKITHTLITEGFKGSRRDYNDCQRLFTRILDDMGEASAKAQGLNRTITNAAKLRDTDHIIYLMVDHQANKGYGSVVGLLKTGSKSLFMFDDNGVDYQLKPRCILDFYIHESRQRMGLGNELYRYMLSEENLKPIKLAIDRPSDKFLAFLRKHYGLKSIIPQNNKFVVFKGFFDKEIQDDKNTNRYSCPPSPNKQSTEYKIQLNDLVDSQAQKNMSINGMPVMRSAYGRYAASRPPCSMANIIHNTAVSEQPAEHIRQAVSIMNIESHERPDSLNLHTQETKKNIQHKIKCIINNSFTKEQATIKEQNPLEDFQNNTSSQFLDEPNSVLCALSNNGTSETLAISNINDKYLKNEINNENIITTTSTTYSQGIVAGNSRPANGHIDLKFYHSPLW